MTSLPRPSVARDLVRSFVYVFPCIFLASTMGFYALGFDPFDHLRLITSDVRVLMPLLMGIIYAASFAIVFLFGRARRFASRRWGYPAPITSQ